jgi:serine/threonine protein kinase
MFAQTESACSEFSGPAKGSHCVDSYCSLSSNYVIQPAMLPPDAQGQDPIDIVNESFKFAQQPLGSLSISHGQVSSIASPHEIINNSVGIPQLGIPLEVLHSQLRPEPLPPVAKAEPRAVLAPHDIAVKQQKANSSRQKAARMAKMAAALRRFEACVDGYTLREALRDVSSSSASPMRMFVAQNNTTSTTHLMKRVDREEMQRFLNLSEAEVDLQIAQTSGYLQHVDHPHLARLYESHQDEQYAYFVMEATKKGSLNTFLDATNQAQVSEGVVANVLEHVLDALQHVHMHGRTHMDVRLDNIMQSDKAGPPVFKLLDLGSPAMLCQNVENRNLRTVAPEVMAHVVDSNMPSDRFDQCSDIWSLGLVAYELLVGRLPFEVAYQGKDVKKGSRRSVAKTDYHVTLKNIERMNVRSDLLKLGHSPEVANLLEQMLSQQPECRPSASECLQHDWVLKQKASRTQQQHQQRMKDKRPDPVRQKTALRHAAALFCASHLPLSKMATAAEHFTSIIGDLLGHTVTCLDSHVQLLRNTFWLDEACARYVASALDEFSTEGDLQEYAETLRELCKERDRETLNLVRAAFESAGQAGLSVDEVHTVLENRSTGLSLLPISDVQAWLEQKSLLGDLPEPRMSFVVVC